MKAEVNLENTFHAEGGWRPREGGQVMHREHGGCPGLLAGDIGARKGELVRSETARYGVQGEVEDKVQ